MIYKTAAALILFGFYFLFIAKAVAQAKQSINTNQMGRGNKPKKVIITERAVSVSTMLATAADIVSVFVSESGFPDIVKITGVVIGVISVIIFGIASHTMRNSWRAGIPEKKTEIITGGIYRISRNPAFLAFDMMYISIVLICFNVPLLIFSVWAAVMLHVQILQEEDWLIETFGEEYEKYRSEVMRYLGRKKAAE